MKLRLFTTHYSATDPQRRQENGLCLQRNLECPAIDQVCLLVEGQGFELPTHPKITARPIGRRPHYSDYFAWINEVAGLDDISIITNSDIYFNDQLSLFRHWRMPADTVMALARWDVGQDGTAALFDRNDSQDTWIFRGPVKPLTGNFPIGVPRCDNRILYELQAAGYRVLNPAFSLRTYHLHSGPRTEYGATGDGFVAPPYHYLWPHNLFGPLRSFCYNTVHRQTRLAWRLDRRRLAATLPWRIYRKVAFRSQTAR